MFDCRTVWSVPCSLDLLALLYVMFSCVYVTFTDVLGTLFLISAFFLALFLSSYTIILIGKHRADCFALTIYLMSCDSGCSVALPQSKLGWSAIFDCGVSLYPFAFAVYPYENGILYIPCTNSGKEKNYSCMLIDK